jgi:hypothetical protein
MAPARRDGAGWEPRAPAPAAQPPWRHLLPRHSQHAGRSVGTVVQLNGDGLDPAHGRVAVAAAKFQEEGKKIQVGRNFKFKLMNCCPSLAHIQSFSPIWPLGIWRLGSLCPGLGH